MSERAALVTGAAQGLGKAIVLRLAKDGYNIAIGDLASQETSAMEVKKEIESLGRKAIFIPLDVSNREEVERAVSRTYEELGSFDTMINNAGICQLREVISHSEEEMRKLIDINLFGVVFGIQAAANKFIELGRPGRIISASSVAGITGAPRLGLYSASKFAVRGLTQTAAAELANKGILVNCYNPGVVATPMKDEVLKFAKENKIGGEFRIGAKSYLDTIPLGRVAQPEDIANVVSFLASEQSSYITGQSFLVDGGTLMH